MESSKPHQTSRPDDGDKEHDEQNDEGNWGTKVQNQWSINKTKLKERIDKFRNQRKKFQNRNVTVLKRSKNVFQALHLPKVLNLNPRSAMNKTEHISQFIEEEEIDVAFISESHDRNNKRLEDHIKLENHTVISNLYQRPTSEKGGRPALIVNNKKYNVENLTNTCINIPWGVEIVWALLTPKQISKDYVIKKIVLGALYVKPGRLLLWTT